MRADGVLRATAVLLTIGMIGVSAWTGWVIHMESSTRETVILHGDGREYSCTVSRIDATPHDCLPVRQ